MYFLFKCIITIIISIFIRGLCTHAYALYQARYLQKQKQNPKTHFFSGDWDTVAHKFSLLYSGILII